MATELTERAKELVEIEVKKALLENFKNSDQYKWLNAPAGPNKLLGGGEKPKQKLHNFDNTDLDNDGGFNKLSDFLVAVKKNDIQALRNCQPVEKDIRSDMMPGAAIIPSKFLAQMIDFMAEESIVMPRAQQFKLSRGQGSELSVPGYEAYDFTSGAVSGINLYFKGEGAAMTETTPTLRQVALKLNKITGWCNVTDETLMSSAINADELIGGLFGRALAWTLDRHFILTGTGAGEPLACVNGNDYIGVAGESGQGAGSINAFNCANLMKKLYPEAWKKAIFIANQSLITDLMRLSFPSGTSYIAIPAYNKDNGKWNIMGIDLKFSQHANYIGSANCLMLADFSRYAVLTRDQMSIKFDPYTLATSGVNRFILNYFVDGQSLDSKVTQHADATTTMTSFTGINAI